MLRYVSKFRFFSYSVVYMFTNHGARHTNHRAGSLFIIVVQVSHIAALATSTFQNVACNEVYMH